MAIRSDPRGRVGRGPAVVAIALSALVVAIPQRARADPVDVLQNGIPPFECLEDPLPTEEAPAGLPLAVLCDLLDRTPLDDPIDQGTSDSRAYDTRAGVQNPDRGIAEARLQSSRDSLPFLENVFTGEPLPAFEELSNRALFPFLDPLTVPGSTGAGTGILNGVVRGQLGLAGRAETDPQFLFEHGIDPAPPGTDTAALRNAALDTLLNPPPDPDNPVPSVQSFDSYFPSLLDARPDRRIDATVLSQGTATDLVPTFALGLGRPGASAIGFPVVGELQIWGLGPLKVSQYCRILEGGRTVDEGGLPCVLPDDPTVGGVDNRVIPTFTGPDGVQYTADDLPISKGNVDGHPLFLTQSDQDNLQLILELNPGFGLPAAPGGTVLLVDPSDGSCNGDGVNAGPDSIPFNEDDECILLMAGDVSSRVAGVLDPAVLSDLADPDLRPGSAVLESAQLTGFQQISGGGGSLPARPRSPDGGLFFQSLGPPFTRRVDAETGAPVRSTGSLACSLRRDSGGIAIGPDGVAETPDDLVSSVGNCLLLGNPTGGGRCDDPDTGVVEQCLRESDQISLDHHAHQALFHTLCTRTFDEDEGYCDVDWPNSASLFGAIAGILSGDTAIGVIAVPGLDTIRLTHQPFQKFRTQIEISEQVYAPTLTRQATGFGDLGSLDPRRRALLGCGPGFATSCGLDDALEGGLLGGVDFMNADASVFGQEFSAVKVARPNELVGSRGAYFEPGISRPIGFTPQDAQALVAAIDPSDPSTAPHLVATRAIRLGPDGIDQSQEFSGFGLVRCGAEEDPLNPTCDDGTYELAEGLTGTQADLTQDPADPDKAVLVYATSEFGVQILEDEPYPTDFLIEPPKWNADPFWLDQGVIVFEDARLDPYRPLSEVNLDPGKINPFGEYCGPLLRASGERLPDPGCTDLEIVSANLVRLVVADEIVGRDDVQDPPETLAEVWAILNGDPNDDATGDPISGPDGIVFNNWFVCPAVVDPNCRGATRKAIQVDPQLEQGINAELFRFEYMSADPTRETCVNRSDPVGRPCYQKLARTVEGRLLAHAMPIGLPGWIEYADGRYQRYLIPTDELDPLELQLLAETRDLSDEGISLGGNPFGAVIATALDPNFIPAGVVPDPNGRVTLGVTGADISQLLRRPKDAGLGVGDLDGDFVRDVDEDFDGVYDFVDDGTPGPVTDDNILCGSGLPGDPLQDAIQIEFVNLFERSMIELPPRSPVFCRGLVQALGYTGDSAAAAPADASSARTDAIWHGGVTSSDTDQDGVPDHEDVCLLGDNAVDADGDGVPDACDSCVDPDRDGVCGPLDNCPGIANGPGMDNQLDSDNDGVGDVCDNCVGAYNPRLGDADRGTPARRSFQTTTGGQLDDDADGTGNRCDAKYTDAGVLVGPNDTRELRASLGLARELSECGTSGAEPCAQFDHNNLGALIGGADVAIHRQLLGTNPAEVRCPACPLDCQGPACAP
jgi:hypothetical protein